MQAVFCETLGGPETLVLREVASPTPGPGEVKVRVARARREFCRCADDCRTVSDET